MDCDGGLVRTHRERWFLDWRVVLNLPEMRREWGLLWLAMDGFEGNGGWDAWLL